MVTSVAFLFFHSPCGLSSAFHTDPAVGGYTTPIVLECYGTEDTTDQQRSLRSYQADRASYGGDFVDGDLKIIIRSSPGTLFSFDPSHEHGTTRLYKKSTVGMAISFSSHIADALAKAQAVEGGVCVNIKAGKFDRSLQDEDANT
jgi:hypothetical protein